MVIVRIHRGYRDRADAGRILAGHVRAALPEHVDKPLVLGLPRGGVPVAAPVAGGLGGELDVLTVRKIGAPGHEELAIGAVATGGRRVLNHDIVSHLRLGARTVEQRTAVALAELAARDAVVRGDRPSPTLAGRTVVLVDDGLATGATMHAAVAAVRTAGPGAVVVAAPVGAPEACTRLAEAADLVVCPLQPVAFRAVGEWYEDFTPTTDDDVVRLLAAAPRPPTE